MRTTLTLEDDVAAAVERLRREEGIGPSEAVNRLVRAGLSTEAGRARPKAYRHKAVPVGLSIDVTDIGSVLDLLDES